MKVKYFEDDHQTLILVQMLGNIQYQKWQFMIGEWSLVFEVDVRE